MHAGGSNAFHVARWDGHAWYPLGIGTNQIVLAVTSWNGHLVAGGFFTEAGGEPASYLARWNGSSWRAIPGLDGPVYALGVYDGDLIAGGTFVNAGDEEAHRIARWDGTQWSALATGIHASPWRPSVSALTVHGGRLIAAGYFTSAGGVPVSNVAAWDGSGWNPLGSGINEEVLALQSYGRLVAAGRFTQAGGTEALGIASWNGSIWEGFTTGIGPERSIVYALAEHRGALYVGGWFATAGGSPSRNIARWDD
jgi:hypothetical protein